MIDMDKENKSEKAQKILDEVGNNSNKSLKKSKGKDLTLKIPKVNIWKLMALVFGVLFIASVVYDTSELTSSSDDKITADAAADKVTKFISQSVAGAEVTVQGKSEENGLHKIDMIIKGDQGEQPLSVYVTLDGEIMFPSAVPLTSKPQGSGSQQQAQPQTVPKSDKPEVELFVMSHCPFGTQSEKGMLPVAELLGDKIDFSIKFVDYSMHGEKELNEEMRQVCISQEQGDKYFDYLWCFLDSEDSESCLADAEVDTDKMESCVSDLDEEFKVTELFNDKSTWNGGRYPQFNVYKDENTEYGVRGSPTLVINGQTVSSSRDSASYLSTVCSAFNDAPEECNEELSSASPSQGFGLEGTGSGTTASCG